MPNPLRPYLRFPSEKELPEPVAERLSKQAFDEVAKYLPNFMEGHLLQGRISAEDAATAATLAMKNRFAELVDDYTEKREVMKSMGLDLDQATGPTTAAERAECRRMRILTERRASTRPMLRYRMAKQLDMAIGKEADVITKRAELNVPIPQLDHVAKSCGWTFAGEENHGPVTMRVFKRGGLDLGLDALSDEWVIAAQDGVIKSGKGATDLHNALRNPNRR